MPIPLGIFATAGAGGAGGSAFELISTQVLTSSASSVTFSSIPATYKHLQIRAVARCNASGQRSIFARFNGNSGNNYARHTLYGDGSEVGSFAGVNQTALIVGECAGNSTGSNVYFPAVTDILDYASTSKNTTTKGLMEIPAIGLRSGLFINTAAVSSIELFPQTDSFVSGSRFSLYGIRG
jgi:hypothetical protein